MIQPGITGVNGDTHLTAPVRPVGKRQFTDTKKNNILPWLEQQSSLIKFTKWNNKKCLTIRGTSSNITNQFNHFNKIDSRIWIVLLSCTTQSRCTKTAQHVETRRDIVSSLLDTGRATCRNLNILIVSFRFLGVWRHQNLILFRCSLTRSRLSLPSLEIFWWFGYVF